ncbi:DNA-3-methyladenine glycosylase family protein [Risungbinella massiliensis]|uniref:DNA-3-methyladenine glycosylase family protein n=1 Tax=Risungbinella massiliensis TaxID=1329796 RepID=UPI0009E65B0B|nr:DNA-3-methyladenine glycosylase [Risungbinella massiliensis]
MTTPKKVMPVFSFDKHLGIITLIPPREFSFTETLTYLSRSPLECLHQIQNRRILKILEIEEKPTLIEISEKGDSSIQVRFVNFIPQSTTSYEAVGDYVMEWFDLRKDLVPFYLMAKNDSLLNTLTRNYFGLRIIGVPDLFEALCWAVIGQQVNLTFAYTLKQRFVQSFGNLIIWNNQSYWLFPKPEQINASDVNKLKELQFTGRKAKYIVGIAQLMKSGKLSKDNLLKSGNIQDIEQRLLSIRGVGPWTAHYVLMRCLREPSAFPIGDAGLHNALKQLLHRPKKPSIQEIQQIFARWKNWEAYAVFYLWRSLVSR